MLLDQSQDCSGRRTGNEWLKGGRALLNLGHTFGHAIEKVAGYGHTYTERLSQSVYFVPSDFLRNLEFD